MDFRHVRNRRARSGASAERGACMERVVIYGGTGGIGLATARALRARGAALHLVGRDPERLERAASELGETGYTAGDVTDPGLFPRVADEAGARLGGLVYAVGTIQLA